jgi:hypothetical protein
MERAFNRRHHRPNRYLREARPGSLRSTARTIFGFLPTKPEKAPSRMNRINHTEREPRGRRDQLD